MAGKSDTFESDLLKLTFQAVAIANFADNAASNPHTVLFCALHTADPTDAGTQSSSEATYTGYFRIGVIRTSGGWAISGTTPTTINPVAAITFPACTAGTSTCTFFSVGVGAINAVTVTSASPGVFSLTSHGLAANTPMTVGGTAIPTGFSAATVYYITAANLLTNSFTLSAAPGGSAINTSSTGTAVQVFVGAGSTKILYSGAISPTISVSNGVTPQLTTATAITED